MTADESPPVLDQIPRPFEEPRPVFGELPVVDAVLLLSFGGPEKPEDVIPFLENVTRGRRIPRERIETVASQYMRFGGRSPINDECRRLVAALRGELARRGPDLPVYWGNRNWTPYLADTVAEMAAAGVRRAVAIATSAYSSYSSCRQYLDDIDRARTAVGPSAPVIEKIAPYWDTPGFLETMTANTRAALDELRESEAGDATGAREAASTVGIAGANRAVIEEKTPPRLVFTAHSLPREMADTCRYEDELRKASALVADRVLPGAPWDLAFQSRSGAPSQPWLEPDVSAHLKTLAASGVTRVVLVPIGFVADHMEVLYDLDVLARETADSVGIKMTRAACVGSAPRFVAGLRDLVAMHMERPHPCSPGCCV
jgi:ferrochelatase